MNHRNDREKRDQSNEPQNFRGCGTAPHEDVEPKTVQSPQGIEIDEQRAYGSNGGWAPQGGQTPIARDESNNDGSEKAPIDATHIGKTQSTTNSQ